MRFALSALRAQPQAPARPAGDEEPGAGDRHGRRRGHRDVRDVPLELRVAARDAAGAYYERQRFADVFASLKRAPLAGRRRHRRHPRRVDHRNARRRQRHARPRTDRRTGHGPARVDSREPAAAAQRSLPAARAVDRAGPPGRGARQRGVRRRARTRAGRSDSGGDQRPPPPPDDRRRGALARVHLQHPARRARARQQAVRDALDRPAGAGRGLRHGGRLQRRGARAVARRADRRRHRPPRSDPRALRRARRDSARAATVALDGGERARAAPELRLHAAAHLPADRRVHSQRGAHPRPGAAAAADCVAQGARLHQHRHRVALPEVGAGHRARSASSWASAWARGSGRWSSRSTTTSSAFPSCSSASRSASSSARRR